MWRLLALAVCAGAGCAPPEAVPETEGFPLTDVTRSAGLEGIVHTHGGVGEAWAPEIVGAGGGFVDYDGDGWGDIIVATGGAFAEMPPLGAHPALRLFRNQHDGTFAEVTHAAGLAGLRAYTFGITAADYDNDGDQDLYVSTLYRDLLLRNDRGVFTDVALDAGVGTAEEWSTSAMFFDADLDGHLDLYVGTYVDWSPEKDIYCGFDGEKVYCTPELYTGIAGRYYHNQGDGTFDLRTAEAGFLSGVDAARDKTLGVAELDANGDGWPDVVIANDTERDMLFVNRGDGTFREQGIHSGIAYDPHGQPRAGMGIDVGVVDASGEPSVFVGNFSMEMVGVYRHIGGGIYSDRAAASRIGQPSLRTLTFGLFLADLDLDTDLDLFIANGHVQTHIARIADGIAFRQPAQLFLNDGSGVFAEAPAAGLLAQPMVGRGAAYGDYDQDGDLDVLLVENNGPAHLWRNDTAGARWIRVELEGRQSNRDAYGAEIRLWSGGQVQVRRIRSGGSYLSHSDAVAVFGLAAGADSLFVQWPGGAIERVTAPAPNTTIRITEDA